MTRHYHDLPLFQWAERHARRPVSPLVRHVAFRGRVSHLHAAAFIEANALLAGAR